MNDSQRDPRWQADLLGTGTLTLGQAGCLVSSAANWLAGQGVDTDPGRLNKWLTQNYGFVDGNLFLFSSIEAFGTPLVDLVFCRSVVAPVARLAQYLAEGCGVLAEVDFTPGGGFQPHWLWLRSLTSGSIIDPWLLPGKTEALLSSYYAAHWTADRAITAAAVYAPARARRVTAVDLLRVAQDRLRVYA